MKDKLHCFSLLCVISQNPQSKTTTGHRLKLFWLLFCDVSDTLGGAHSPKKKALQTLIWFQSQTLTLTLFSFIRRHTPTHMHKGSTTISLRAAFVLIRQHLNYCTSIVFFSYDVFNLATHLYRELLVPEIRSATVIQLTIGDSVSDFEVYLKTTIVNIDTWPQFSVLSRHSGSSKVFGWKTVEFEKVSEEVHS